MLFYRLAMFVLCLLVPLAVLAQDKHERPKIERQEEQPPPQKKSPPRERGFVCAGKTKCAQMTSCAEALFYLKQCGLRRLDRDNDGIPCETICR